jgi:surface protein
MKNSKPYPSKPSKATSATNSSTANNNNNAIKDGPDDHDDGDVEVGRPSSIASAAPPNIDVYQRKRSGETKSNPPEPASVVPSDATPRRERGLQGKVSSTPGQDVSRPGAFRVGVEAGSSNAPTGEGGFSKDEFIRHRPGETASPSATAASRDWRSNMDAYNRKVAGETAPATVPSSSAPPDAPTRERGFGMDAYNRKVAGETVTAPATVSLSAAPPDAPTRERGFGMDAYNRKVARETKSAAAPSSSAPTDAPKRERGFGMDEYNRKLAGETVTAPATVPSSLVPLDASSSATEDQEPEDQEGNIPAAPPPSLTQGQHDLQPGAFRVDGAEGGTLSETGFAERVAAAATATALPPDVPEIHQSRENAQGQYLAEANLVLEPDLVYGEPLEEPKVLWRQPKVQRLAFFVFLLVVGLVVGVGVGVGGGSTSASPIFDCSNTKVGCLYIGSQSLDFQDPDSFLVANCTDTNFEIPTNDNCECEVNVPTSNPEGFESCQSCSFVNADDGEWRLAYDCSNLLRGDCVGRDTSNNCISRLRFNTTSELRDAVTDYLADNSTDALVAGRYGWPIGIWDVSKIQDFGYLFSGDESAFSEHFNSAAANFNEDISGWKMSSATTMTSMFAGARSFDQPIGSWNVSSVRDMSFMFSRTTSFDQPIGDWNVSRVTDMSNMFYSAISFNAPLGDWEVSSVRDMTYMFSHAKSFNSQSIADWDISNETDMRGIFAGADGIVQVQVQVKHDIYPEETGWTLRDSSGTLIASQSTGSFDRPGRTVTTTFSAALGTYTFEMTDAFEDGICCENGSGSFSIAVNGETVVSNNGQFTNITQETFEVLAPTASRLLIFETRDELREAVGLYVANNVKSTLVVRNYGWPIGIWDVSQIQDFSYLFAASDFDGSGVFNPAAANFNEDISGWNVSSVRDVSFMFYGATSFNQPLADWNVSSMTDMRYMFQLASSFSHPIGDWDVSSVTDMRHMFQDASSFNHPLGNWNVSSVTDMAGMFTFAESFNQQLEDWNVSSVWDMSFMFSFATSFNQPLADWNVSSVTDMRYMFQLASSFNQPLADWKVSSVTDMSRMFFEATSFNQPLADWNVSSVQDMTNLFRDAASFNQPLAAWDVSSVAYMTGMFSSATSFNQPLADWNMSSVVLMAGMFQATSFDQPLAGWDVSRVEEMWAMFAFATSFNQSLADWNVSSVLYMDFMFYEATSFNQPLADWNVSSVKDMAGMFAFATSFNQPLGNWDVSSETDLTDVFGNSGCPGAVGEESCFYIT